MPVDGRRSIKRSTYGIYDGRIDQLNPPVSSEIKDGQWLGVEVKSQGEGGKVIVCAHRYTIRDIPWPGMRAEDTKRGMIGLCYLLDANLKVLESDQMGYKSVMVIRDAVDGKSQEPKKGSFDDHAKWGVCQVGASVSFVEESLEGDTALFGAPGCFAWRGNLLAQQVGKLDRYDVAVNDGSFLQYAKHGLMGVAVASGRFFDGELYYVSGAPHAQASGQVYFFGHETPGKSGVLVPKPELTLTGQDYGAAFGLSLEKCDVNGDGSPDLIVGAPFYDDQDSDGHQRGGAVFVFTSKNRRLHSQRKVKFVGKELLSQFGLSLTCMGDMNKDGYQDFAVGAPYEASNGGSVYIFFGRSDWPESQVQYKAEMAAVQILSPSLFRGQADFQTFGSSLSGGLDMDGNSYPDLVVGAYASNAVFMFRARPIIDISTYVDDKNLRGIDPGAQGCSDDPTSRDACFGFSACFKVSQEDLTDHEQRSGGIHHLQYLIEAEAQKAVSRVYLRLASSVNSETPLDRNSSVQGLVRVDAQVQEHQCIRIVGYVGSTHLDLQSPVQFQMTYSLVQDEPQLSYNQDQALPRMEDFPILNQAEAKRKFQATFEKDCGADDICKTHLILKPSLRDKAGKELSRTPTGEAYELELGSLVGSELVLSIQVVNQMEPAYEASLDVFFPPALQYIGFLLQDAQGNDNSTTSQVLNTQLKNATWLSLSLGNPFKASTATLQLRFQPKPDTQDKIIVFYLSANTTSLMLMDASTFVNLAIVRRAEVKLLGNGFPEHLHYGYGLSAGQPSLSAAAQGENAFTDLSQVGPPIIHKFLLINSGPSMVDVLRLHIRWPYQVENGGQFRVGKWLLYLSEHPSLKNGRGVCYLPPGVVANPLNLSSTTPEKYVVYGRGLSRQQPQKLTAFQGNERRQKRSQFSRLPDKVWVEKVVSPRTIQNEDGVMQVITLDCDRGTAKCLDIRCDVYNLPVQVPATVEVRARLWNSTLVEDYHSVDLVEIFTKAEIKLDGDVSQYVGDDELSIRTVVEATQGRTRASFWPDWWIILASVLAGLLVLVIISSVLWKLGFFKRQRPLSDSEPDDSDLMMSAHFEKVRLNSDY